MAELYDIICPTLMDHRAHKTENTCFRIHIQVALWGWKKKKEAKSKGEESFPTNPASVPRTGWMDATEDAAAKDSKPFIIIFFFSQVDPTILGCLSLFFFTTVFDSHKDFSCYFRKTWLPYSEKSNDFCLNFLICPSYSPCLLFYPTIQIDRVIV